MQRDIDLVTFIDYELVEKLGAKLDVYKSPASEVALILTLIL